MKLAVEGCCHGELDKIYETIGGLESRNNIKVDLLLICGDFQAVRNRSDLMCMAVPQKYQKLNTFYKYYSGEKKAPILTIIIGGNHEASNYMSELPYGGWVCENIYYLGYASVIEVGGLRIAGLSGIYKGQDYLKGHFEVLPYDESAKRSVYHVRNLDVFRLKQLRKPIDIFISHDWPRGIQDYGDKEGLLRYKPYFRVDMDSGRLGSRPAEELLFKLKPSYWFAAHLHCEFAAIVPHSDETSTKFLALDKCLPRKRFLKILDIDSVDKPGLEMNYDLEWLSILRSTNHLLSVSKNQSYMPGQGCSERWDFSASDEELAETNKLFNNDFSIPHNFHQTALPHSYSSPGQVAKPELLINPQTTLFCKKLGIDDPLQLLAVGSKGKNVKEYSFIDDLNVTNVSENSFNPDQSSEENMGKDDNLECAGLFYIDKKGASSPNDSFSFSQPLTSSPVPSVTVPKITFDFPEYKDKNISDIASASDSPTILNNSGPRPFKIKRRNQSLYTADDED